ncbi:hypothetical protein K469DRAFT_676418 [Zopfia rhizophila CBS 207.26]|uniref:Zn(2)-C6 fungal-type domain-containing protein n=1 Tax=Zopfia rhizophila CBS 207.26 TaxID=1314779 RepID=A0A6A6DFM4_9PEZI|nr:hypothetical protein K469DRAFT_676418 [Zopfia rhizophila CBS 207.26]
MSDSRTPGKRSACDRCRTQKLRCLRVPGHPTDSCIRCVRSQMECVSSSSKRPGRPRNSTNASRQHTDPTPATCNDPNPSLPAVDIHPLANVDDWFNLGLLEANYEICSAPWNSVDSGFPMDGGGTAHTMSSLSTPPDGTSTSASLNSLMTETSLSEHFPNLQSEQADNGMLQLFGHQPSASNFDHGLHLSVLQRDFSKQLFTLKSMPWDITKVMRLTCMHDASGNSSNPSQADPEMNPLAKIAKTSAEFAKLLRSVQTPMASDGDNATKNASPLSCIHPRLSIADLLTILSCHMLTISIYDSIFCHFTDQALHNPGAVNIVMQSAPKLFLGGIAVPPRLDMLGHLLYRLTGSQLRPIEMLLGLPDEFRVSSKRDLVSKDKQTGLFSGQSGQLLCSTLMKVETERASEERGGLGVIESLKEKIRLSKVSSE